MTLTLEKTDHQIHQAVLQELKWDTRVDETEVGVQVEEGVVTLTGAVSSYAKKMAAQEAAHRVKGVLDVANDMTVKIPGVMKRNDTEIAQAVRRALEWDALVPNEKIETTVSNGWVSLTGSVPFWADRSYAERTVRNLLGVQGVINNLTVSTPSIAAHAVRNSIEQALERRAEREADRIKVEAHDGAVSLTGRVHSWQEKQAVLGAASYAPGVRKVEDHLRIDPYF